MKGILFKPWKIKAITANPDKEWQTRRAIKPQPTFSDGAWDWRTGKKYNIVGFSSNVESVFSQSLVEYSHYHVGEVVYIKEAHYAYGHWTQFHESGKSHWEFFRALDMAIQFADTEWQHALTKPSNKEGWYKRSPMFLEAKYARYFIKITGIEACQTKGITPEDCEAEGIITTPSNFYGMMFTWPEHLYQLFSTPQAAYFALYDSINGTGAHERNWDWKDIFKLVDKPTPQGVKHD